MLYHCLRRDQLQNRAPGIFLIRHAVLKYSDGFPDLLRIGILNPCVSHFRQVEQAAKALFGYHMIVSRKGYGKIEKQDQADATPGDRCNLRKDSSAELPRGCRNENWNDVPGWTYQV